MADEIQLITTSVSIAGPILLGILLYWLNEKSKMRQFEREKKYDRLWAAYSNVISSIRTAIRVREAVLMSDPKIKIEYAESLLASLPQFPQKYELLTPEQANHIELLMCMTASATLADDAEIEYISETVGPSKLTDQTKYKEAKQKLRTTMAQSAVRRTRKAKEQLDESLSSLRLLGIPKDLMKDIRALSEKIFLGTDPPNLYYELEVIETRIQVHLQNSISAKET
jgi:hypothetical protein